MQEGDEHKRLGSVVHLEFEQNLKDEGEGVDAVCGLDSAIGDNDRT